MPPSLAFIQAATQAACLPDPCPDIPLTGVSIDSRTVQRGELFAALSGPNFDGHDFIPGALEKGCAAILAERPPPTPTPLPVPLLLVDDVLTALSRAARAWRRQVDPLVVAVTGSCGKTTVKEMTAACLGRGFQRVHATVGNLNNHIGLPLTLLRMDAACQALVVEMGMSAAGEIAHLAALAEADVGVITNVLAAHLDSFATGLEGVADAKGELFEALPPGATAILEANAPFTARLHEKIRHATPIAFSQAETGVWAEPDDGDPTRPFTIHWPDAHTPPITLAGHGRHLLVNALAAAAAARALGCTPEAIAAGLDGFGPPAGRGRVRRTPGGVTLIDDCYNANPGSVAAALAAMPPPEGAGRRVAVLGDMLELGKQAESLHEGLIRHVVTHGVTTLYCAGPLMGALHRATAAHPGVRSHHRDDPAGWLGRIAPDLRAGDVVLVKGSRGMKMERIVEDLSGHAL